MKIKFLNLAGRTVLAKATLNNILSHVMQYISIPFRTTYSINKIQRDFSWGTSTEKRKIHLIGWDTITRNNGAWGLGIQKCLSKE